MYVKNNTNNHGGNYYWNPSGGAGGGVCCVTYKNKLSESLKLDVSGGASGYEMANGAINGDASGKGGNGGYTTFSTK